MGFCGPSGSSWATTRASAPRRTGPINQKWRWLKCVAQCLLYTLALVANVLLVNLLIAVTNSTYE